MPGIGFRNVGRSGYAAATFRFEDAFGGRRIFRQQVRSARRTCGESPPQLGHFPASTVSTHDAQKVHSKEQIRASDESGGRSALQHSQLGLI